MSQDRSVDESGLRVLVPLDGSQQATRAVEVAKYLPTREIVLLHVEPDDLMIMPGFSPADHEGETSAIREELEQVAAPLRAEGQEVNTSVCFGDASEQIMEAAHGFDLVVMTTRGRGAAGRILFGSTADRVSRHSSTPTLLIRSDQGTVVTPRARIVVPLDGSETSERALPMATTIAAAMSVPLHLWRAVDLDNVRATISELRKSGEMASSASEKDEQTYEDARQLTEQRAAEYLDALAGPLRAEGLAVETRILQGTPAFVLTWNIETEDLVVMTSHGRKGFRRWLLGSVAEKLVREAKAPVILVPTRESTPES